MRRGKTKTPSSTPVKTRHACGPFFIHPQWARRGIGQSILAACEKAIMEAGFSQVEMVATLVGEPLYASCGYNVTERFDIQLAGGLPLPALRMGKTLPPPP